MANLIRRTNGDEDKQQARSQAIEPAREHNYDPWRVFRDLMRWDPFSQIQHMFGRGQNEMFEPSFEVADHKDRFVIKADMPGVKEQDVDVKISGNRLTVSGKRESEHEDRSDTYYACERSYGSFTRSFTLPHEQADVEHATASLDSGVLTIAIPKKEQAQSRKIEVKRPQQKS